MYVVLPRVQTGCRRYMLAWERFRLWKTEQCPNMLASVSLYGFQRVVAMLLIMNFEHRLCSIIYNSHE